MKDFLVKVVSARITSPWFAFGAGMAAAILVDVAIEETIKLLDNPAEKPARTVSEQVEKELKNREKKRNAVRGAVLKRIFLRC